MPDREIFPVNPIAVPAARSSGTLYVVATPIGNLEDITLRALRVLREATVVAAEDTRRTRQLLRHFQIDTPLVSLHAHNEHEKRHAVVERLLSGDAVALVSDAGTPGISDPGAALVRAAREAGLRVEPVPGPSAVTAAISASGFSGDRFAFGGFPPVKSRDRKVWLNWLKDQKYPVVCFEAPHRAAKTLVEIRQLLAERPILVARELTKLHEDWTWLPPESNGVLDVSLLPRIAGEFVFVIGPVDSATTSLTRPTDEEIAELFGQITSHSWVGSRRDAVRATAERLGVSPNDVFDALERLKSIAP